MLHQATTAVRYKVRIIWIQKPHNSTNRELWPGDMGNNGSYNWQHRFDWWDAPSLHQGYQPPELFLNAFIKPIIWMFPKKKMVPSKPQSIHFNRVFHYKPSILGYPHFWIISLLSILQRGLLGYGCTTTNLDGLDSNPQLLVEKKQISPSFTNYCNNPGLYFWQ